MLGLTVDQIEEFRIKLLSAVISGSLSRESAQYAINASHELAAFRGALEAHDQCTYTSPCPQDIAAILQVQAMETLDGLLRA